MKQSEWERVIDAAIGPAKEYLESLPSRAVYRPVDDPGEIRGLVGGPLPEEGTDPAEVVAALARDVEPFITAHACGRFFGFVVGGLHPAAYGADLLTATWDQNGALFPVTPGTAVVEEVAVGWLLDLLDLPSDASVGLVTVNFPRRQTFESSAVLTARPTGARLQERSSKFDFIQSCAGPGVLKLRLAWSWPSRPKSLQPPQVQELTRENPTCR